MCKRDRLGKTGIMKEVNRTPDIGDVSCMNSFLDSNSCATKHLKLSPLFKVGKE